MALPMPPAKHMVSRPSVPSVASSPLSSVVMMRAPVIPNVAERDRAAERVELPGVDAELVAAGHYLRGERLVELDDVDASIVIAACSSTPFTAGIGPRPMISGRIAATEEATIRARGLTLSAAASFSDMTRIAAAPSFKGHELPAVTVRARGRRPA
jgi:hypothetical protein